jgi:Rad3-related DNA helicase
MVGCLIRSEEDRGIVVIVEGRSEKEAARGDGDRRRGLSGDTLSRQTRRSS